ncbi:hypothetical protein D3C77_501650 [compost metagenome]
MGGKVTATAESLQALRASFRDEDAEGDLAGALSQWDSTAAFAVEVKASASRDEAIVRKTETLEASLGNTNAAVQTTSQALVNLEGKASTMWSVKMQLNSQGQYVAAGIGLGIENGPAGLQSQFLVNADRFAVVNGINGNLSSPFAVQGGQVFINQGFIQDGTITNAKIGSFISSTDYVPGVSGWRLDKSGTLEFNGTVAGGGRLTITNRAVKVFDAEGVLRVQLGDLTA